MIILLDFSSNISLSWTQKRAIIGLPEYIININI